MGARLKKFRAAATLDTQRHKYLLVAFDLTNLTKFTKTATKDASCKIYILFKYKLFFNFRPRFCSSFQFVKMPFCAHS